MRTSRFPALVRRTRQATTIGLVLSLLAFTSGPARSYDDAEPRRDSGLVERTGRTLTQLTVKIRVIDADYRSQAAHLTKSDFFVSLDFEEVPSDRFDLDGFCPEPHLQPPPDTQEPSKHVLLFLNSMALEGLTNTSAMLRTMIPRLAAEGYRMKLLPDPAATSLGWSGDADQLLQGLERLLDPGGSPKNTNAPRVDRVRELLESNRVDEAIAVARDRERAVQPTIGGFSVRLAQAISEMADLPPPKAMIYFSETGVIFRESVVEAAVRAGVLVYTVKADGQGVFYNPRNYSLLHDPGAIASSALRSFSTRTGGQFSLGHSRKKAADGILEKVQTDLSCVYVLSIDASGLDRDRLIRPRVKLRPGFAGKLEASTIPSFAIASPDHRREAAVRNVFRSAGWPSVQPGTVSILPIGFDESGVRSRIQFSMDFDPGAPSIPRAWDVGISCWAGPRVSEHGNSRILSRSPTLVFEKEMRLPFDCYQVLGVAAEVDGNRMARGALSGCFEKPKKHAVEVVQPASVLQWEEGAFVSDGGAARTSGFRSLRYAMAHTDRDTLFIVSVCRGKDVRKPLTLERSLVLPEAEIRLSRTDWPREEGSRCLSVKTDILAAGRLPWSNQPYEATFVATVEDPSGVVVARTSRAFWVIGPSR